MADRYQQTLDYLYSFVDYETQHQPRSPLNYDLRRVEELLARLGRPHLAAKTVHVTGTKGKGSTAAMIASILRAAGCKTGLFTSPHLIDLRERIRIDGRLISQVGIIKLVERLIPEVEAVNQAATYGKLTTFELLTALGFLYFAEKKANFQVIEVGLGGRLDATNVVCPEVSVISNISLDHTDVLGDSLAQIAAEKAGIIKEGVPVISACQAPEARRVISQACRDKGSVLFEVTRDITYRGIEANLAGQRLEIRGLRGSYDVTLPLLGEFQEANAALAVGAIEVLMEKGINITARDIVAGLKHVRWPGRFQVIRRRPLIILDGAHNPASACELKKAVLAYAAENTPKILVIGSSSDKDYKGVAAELAPAFDVVIVTRTRHPRALSNDLLAEVFRPYNRDLRTTPTVATALDSAVSLAKKDGLICASGSLFIVGEALEWAKKPSF